MSYNHISGIIYRDYNNLLLMVLCLIFGLLQSIRVPYNIVVSSTGMFKESGIQTGITCIVSIAISISLSFINYSLVLVGPIVFYAVNVIYQHFMLRNRVIGFKDEYYLRHFAVILFGIGTAVVPAVLIPSSFLSKSFINWFLFAVSSFALFSFILVGYSLLIDRVSFFNSVRYFKRRFFKR